MLLGLAFDAEGKSALGFRTLLTTRWKYAWKVEIGGGVMLRSLKTSLLSSNPTRA